MRKYIGSGGGPVKTGINHNELGPVLHGFRDVFETDGMIFCGIAADDHDAITVGNIIPVIGHGSPTKSGPQRGHGGGVSDPGLMFQIDDAQSPSQFVDKITLFVVQSGAADTS